MDGTARDSVSVCYRRRSMVGFLSHPAGQAGMIEIRTHKGMGLVSQVFTGSVLHDLIGHMAIGHTRYSTTGSSHIRNAQPLTVDCARGQIAIAHNGNLTNAARLREQLEAKGSIFQTTVDSEIILHLMAQPRVNGEGNNLIHSI